MKKKTSLWISGITTVAMLAVAVGSFAAWDSLTPTAQTFSAKSGTPATLTVDTTTNITGLNYLTSGTTATLVPKGALKSTNDTDALYGGFKVELTDGKEADIYLVQPTLDSAYKITVQDMGENGTGTATDVSFTSKEIQSGDTRTVATLTNKHQYKVKVEFAKEATGADSVDGSGYATATDINTSITCVAVAK